MASDPLRDHAYKHIHGMLLAGELLPGQTVSEHSLAREIGISRTPVREAIRRLEQEGVLEQVPRVGTIVREPQRRDLEELYQLREALEPYAVSQIGGSLSKEDVDLLSKLCEEIRLIGVELKKAKQPAADATWMRRLLSADLGFHMVLLRASGNRRLMKIIADSRVLTRIFGTPRQEHNLAVIEETYQFHKRILDALKKHDGESARKLMADHIRASMDETLRHFDEAQALSNARKAPLDLPEDLLDDLQRIERSGPRPSAKTRPKIRPSPPQHDP